LQQRFERTIMIGNDGLAKEWTVDAPDELVGRILAELDQMRHVARDFVDNVDPRFEDLEGEDGEGARIEVRETLERISAERGIDVAVRELAVEDHRDSDRSRKADSTETDPALMALTTAGSVEGDLSSAESRVRFWWTKFQARGRNIGQRAREWMRHFRDYASLIRQSLQAVLSWLTQLISSMRTPTGWAIAGSMNISPFGLGGTAQLEISFGPPPRIGPPSSHATGST
jgi:hypothetical protein